MNELCNGLSGSKRYRILALDGGGIKGAYTASVLATLERMTHKKVSEQFDLITGTSTGGIIAIAIGLGIPTEAVLDLYVMKGTHIFAGPPRVWWKKLGRSLRCLFSPKHSQEVLRHALGDVFGDRVFGESKCRLIIPAFNAVDGQVYLFKTPHCSEYRLDLSEPAVDVALSTAAAPTYFSAFTDERGRSFVDGGVWANCPVLVGIAEAVGKLAWPLESLDILSIGTTDEPVDITRKQRNGGRLQWASPIANVLLAAQVRGTLGIANAMVRDRLHRIDVVTRPGRFALYNSNEVSELRALGENSARKVTQEILDRFFGSPVASFEPCAAVGPREVTGMFCSSTRSQNVQVK